MQVGKINKEKKEKQRNIHYLQDQRKFSFQPEINPLSDKMAQERSKIIMSMCEESSSLPNSETLIPGNKFEFLFEDAKRRQDHMSKLNKIIPDTECTFKPDIGPSKSHLQNFTEHSFMERLAKNQKDTSINQYYIYIYIYYFMYIEARF